MLSQLSQNQGASGSHRRHHDSKQFDSAFAAAAEAVGVDQSKVGDLQKQIDKAVADAKQNGSGGDSRQAVGQAVDSVLKDNGIDPAKFHDAMKAQFQKMRAQGGVSGAEQGRGGAQGPDSDGDNDASPAPQAGTIGQGGLDTSA
jgi:hypothetical protein